MAGMAFLLFHLKLYFIPNGPKIDNLAVLRLTVCKVVPVDPPAVNGHKRRAVVVVPLYPSTDRRPGNSPKTPCGA